MTDENGKAAYATCVAEEIVRTTNKVNQIPPKVLELFQVMTMHLNLKRRVEYESLIGATGNC